MRGIRTTVTVSAGLLAATMALGVSAGADDGRGAGSDPGPRGHGQREDPRNALIQPVVSPGPQGLLAVDSSLAAADYRRDPPGSVGGRRVLEVIASVGRGLTRTRYQHRTVVRERRGEFLWDCSGMADWILDRAAPTARRAISRERPVARDFFRVIDRAPSDRGRRGWQRIDHIRDARPGDVFAWLRPPNWPRRNTGHVGFVTSTPEPVAHVPGAYALRIVDATSLPHGDDTRDYEGEGGFGEGTIMFLTDGRGTGTAYGWFGPESRGVVVTRIVFGRVTR